MLRMSLKTQGLSSCCCSGSLQRDGGDLWFPSHSVCLIDDWPLGHLIPLAYQMAPRWHVTPVARAVICMRSVRRRKMKAAKTDKNRKKRPRCRYQTRQFMCHAPSVCIHFAPRQLLIISTLSPLCTRDANPGVKEHDLSGQPCLTRSAGLQPCYCAAWAAQGVILQRARCALANQIHSMKAANVSSSTIMKPNFKL